MPVHVIAFGSGCLVGALVVALLCRCALREILVETARVIEVNAELRAEVLGHIFRPVTPEEEAAVLAEWLSQYDPRYHTE